MDSKSFTLIELLIVVAVIGLLAAISIPDFSNTLIRAKVARMGSDTRILAMAIEIYCIDSGWYPYTKSCDPNHLLCSVFDQISEFEQNRLPQIFNPIPYATSVPNDVFRSLHDADSKCVAYSLTYAHLFQQYLKQKGKCYSELM